MGQILTMAGVPFSFGATELSVDLVNTLEARSQAGTDALINKHDFGGLSITVNIPEPASGVLLGVGLVGWFAAVRRPKCRKIAKNRSSAGLPTPESLSAGKCRPRCYQEL